MFSGKLPACHATCIATAPLLVLVLVGGRLVGTDCLRACQRVPCRPGTGTITVWENVGGSRSEPVLQLTGIPLTPGPLVVVLKVANSQTGNATGYWPPSLRDSIETIAASYVQGSSGSKVRLFNLAPGIKTAGMTCSGNGTDSGQQMNRPTNRGKSKGLKLQ